MMIYHCSRCRDSVVFVGKDLVTPFGGPCTDGRAHDSDGAGTITSLWSEMLARGIVVTAHARHYTFTDAEGELILSVDGDYADLARDLHPAEMMLAACFAAQDAARRNPEKMEAMPDLLLLDILRSANRQSFR